MPNKRTLVIVVVTAVVVLMFADKLGSLPLVNKIPKF